MNFNKVHLIVFLVGIFLGLCTGFFTGKALYDKPLDVGTKTDTIVVHDTIPDYNPVPVDSARVRYVTKWLPVAVHDTCFDTRFDIVECHDTIQVQVPITQKHYRALEYDAWVSGFDPSLDSIKVYQKTKVVTTTITQVKHPNKFELDAVAGIDYNTAIQRYAPYAGGELLYKPNRMQVGLQGGVVKNDKVEPYVGAKLKLRVF